MILGVPVMDGHEWTKGLVQSLAATVSTHNFRLVIVDNNSSEPYRMSEFDQVPFPIDVIRNEENKGFYSPILQLRELFPYEDYIGLAHNDIKFFEVGWETRLAKAFIADSHLALVGLCGSWQVDEYGGRGGGTMCYFRERDAAGNIIGQSQAAGEMIMDLRPTLVLDSLFMMFRASHIPYLAADEDIPTLAHFYDRIWPLRLIEQGWRAAVLGSEIAHWGGITLVANPRYQAACKAWCEARGLTDHYQSGNWDLTQYHEGERRYLTEFRDQKKAIPASINLNYEITRW